MADQARVVGVYPSNVTATHARLLDALSCALPVSFHPLSDELAPDAIVILSGLDAYQSLNLPAVPCLVAVSEGQSTEKLEITLSKDAALDPRLRGRTLEPESAIEVGVIDATRDDRVFAQSHDGPIWLQRGDGDTAIEITTVPIPELDPDEVVRDCLSPGRCMALLPLFHFLREVSREIDWKLPPLRASLMIDDPNLHGMSYGFIGFPSLVDHAETHNYHLSSATIPLDGWYVNRRAAQCFQQHADRVSLLVHGNNHSRHELAQDHSEAECVALAAQALRRISKLESRSGLRVARVMAAPHGKCSTQMAAGMARVGFDAMCHSRPFPWIKRLPADVTLAGMAPAQWTEEGLPVLPRFSMEASETDIALRAFLGQPLIMLGHHWDAVNDYALFERAAAIANSLGDVQWMGMEAMARSNYSWKRQGDVLYIRPYSKHVVVDVPDGVHAIEVETPAVGGCSESGVLDVSGTESSTIRENGVLGGTRAEIAGTTCTVRWRHTRAIDPATVDAPGTPLKHVARRMATEIRDRMQPITGR